MSNLKSPSDLAIGHWSGVVWSRGNMMKFVTNDPYPCQGLSTQNFLFRLLLHPQVRRCPHQRVLGGHRWTLRRRVSEDDEGKGLNNGADVIFQFGHLTNPREDGGMGLFLDHGAQPARGAQGGQEGGPPQVQLLHLRE